MWGKAGGTEQEALGRLGQGLESRSWQPRAEGSTALTIPGTRPG